MKRQGKMISPAVFVCTFFLTLHLSGDIQPIPAQVQRGRQVKPYTSNSGFCCDTYAFAPWQGHGRSGMAAVSAVSAHSRPLSELIQQLFSNE